MSRRSSRRGRPYQPLPARHTNWAARLVIFFIAFALIAGIAILSFAR
jgi:type IV secretory pathway component VirB8